MTTPKPHGGKRPGSGRRKSGVEKVAVQIRLERPDVRKLKEMAELERTTLGGAVVLLLEFWDSKTGTEPEGGEEP